MLDWRVTCQHPDLTAALPAEQIRHNRYNIRSSEPTRTHGIKHSLLHFSSMATGRKGMWGAPAAATASGANLSCVCALSQVRCRVLSHQTEQGQPGYCRCRPAACAAASTFLVGSRNQKKVLSPAQPQQHHTCNPAPCFASLPNPCHRSPHPQQQPHRPHPTPNTPCIM